MRRVILWPLAFVFALTPVGAQAPAPAASWLDPGGNRKDLGFARNRASRASLGLVLRYMPEMVKRAETIIPYPVEIGVFHGGGEAGVAPPAGSPAR
ncbi:MAG: hypothetical protein IT165_03660 [Bryobacterales bacterium]|nr:hypothetical protein [Bryobacterales bacterium]